MRPPCFDTLLAATQRMHRETGVLSTFVEMPDDVTAQPVDPKWIKAAAPLVEDPQFATDGFADVTQAVRDAARHVTWRETYKGTEIGQDFLDRFACFCLIGSGGPYTSDTIHSYFVYMPPHLHYTWHHHPAEEMYFVVAGEGRFHRQGLPSETLRPGQAAFHASNQPHALDTDASGLLAYVVWRNGFGTPPRLTEVEACA